MMLWWGVVGDLAYAWDGVPRDSRTYIYPPEFGADVTLHLVWSGYSLLPSLDPLDYYRHPSRHNRFCGKYTVR